MLAKLSILSLAVLAVATPNPKPWQTTTPPVTTTVTVTAPASTSTIPASSCSTGPVQCCNSVQSASNPAVTSLLGLLGIVLSDLDVLVGLTCTPISIIGIGGNSCSAQAVCCQDNAVGGLISIGCLPVQL